MFDFDAIKSELQKCRDLARDFYGNVEHDAWCMPLDGPNWTPGETPVEAWAEANHEEADVFSATSVDPLVALRALQEQIKVAISARARSRVIRRTRRPAQP